MTKEKFHVARSYANLTVGGMVRTIRELQGMSQTDLAEASGIDQPIISGIENDRIALGVPRAKRLARALNVHPAVLLFPDWEEEKSTGKSSRDRPTKVPRARSRKVA